MIKTKSFTEAIIKENLSSVEFTVEGDRNIECNHVSPLIFDCSGGIMFCTKVNEQNSSKIDSCKGCIIVVPKDFPVSNTRNLYVKTANPRLAYCLLLKEEASEKGHIHPTAIVNSEAVLGRGVRIGAYAIVGKATLGDHVIIGAHTIIEDNVKIGSNVNIDTHCRIGGDGFGYEKDNHGFYTKFPHFGGVIIEDYVDIGSMVCIDRGTLSDTIVRAGVRIDNLVHIAHNCDIGENVMLIALTTVSGSAKVGRDSWIAPHVAINNGVTIGKNAFIGIGVTCISDIKDGESIGVRPPITLPKA